FLSWIIFGYKSIYEWSMYPARRNAIASDIAVDIIFSNRHSHCKHCSLAHRISKTVPDAHRRSNRSKIENGSSLIFLGHVSHDSVQAIIHPLYIDLVHLIKVFFTRIQYITNMRNSCIVNQYIYAAFLLIYLLKSGLYFCLMCYIAHDTVSNSIFSFYFFYNFLGICSVHFKYVHYAPPLGKKLSNSFPYSTASSCYNGYFFI